MPHKDPEARRKWQREWKRKNPDKVAANKKRFEASLKKQGTSLWKKYTKGKVDEGAKKRIYRYGEEANAAFESATNCYLCGSSGRLCIDHCHETSVFRGVLCYSCNVALGLLKDDPELLRRAASYIEASRKEVAA